MQLSAATRASSLRIRLGAAACMLLAAAEPAAAAAEQTSRPPAWEFEGVGLFYAEKDRVTVIEPVGRITRLLSNGQTVSAQVALDAISGASPSGALPSGRIQTTTTPSGNVTSSSATQVPTSMFSDLRGALDLGWQVPLGTLFVPRLGVHASREKDYQSLGANAEFSLDLMHRLTTLTVGGGINRDGVFPVGGTPVPLDSTGGIMTTSTNDKKVTTALVGLSRILTRRWMVGVNLSHTNETGYLTEPYKVVSVVDPATGYTVGQFTEKRPSARARESVLANSVYHLTDDVLYVSYRYYWDDWGVGSHTVDARYRHELGGGTFLQPHVRLYAQTAADFFRFGVIQGAPLPEFMTADDRLGSLRTATLGATYGFRLPDYPGEFTVRAEYMYWWGNGSPDNAVGVQREIDPFPGVNIGSFMVGYSLQF